jgi:hypothetical protein
MEAVEHLYRSRSYWSLHQRDVLLSAAPCLVAIAVILNRSYDSVVKQLRDNWKDNRCNPVYLPFAGVIQPQPGQSALNATINNFDYCVRRDLTGAMKLMLMPLEFVSFSILSVLDLLIQGMLLTFQLLQALKNLMGSISAKIHSKLMAAVVPLILFVAKLRDTLAKVNAVSMTAIFTTYTVYNTMVSGLLSITSVIVDLLIGMAATITAMFAAALILMNPLTFPAGIALFAVANGLLTAIFIPTVILYGILQAYMSSVFGKKARPAPATPFGNTAKMKDLEQKMKAIADAAKKAAEEAAKKAAEAALAAKKAAEEAAKKAAEEAAKAGKAVGGVAKDVGKGVKKIF